jgi:hypothetical protein
MKPLHLPNDIISSDAEKVAEEVNFFRIYILTYVFSVLTNIGQGYGKHNFGS